MNMEIELILDNYCRDEMKKLKQMCYPMLIKIGGISEKDYDDFYSIALDALADSVMKYNPEKDCQFNTFLFGNINRKFKTEIRDRNRNKRIPTKQLDSMSCLVSEDGLELSETIPSNFNTYEIACERMIEGTKIERYLNKLSLIQRKIVSLLSDGYKANDIKKILNISNREYQNHLAAIQVYENVKILM